MAPLPDRFVRSHTSGDWGTPPEIFYSWEPTPTIGTNSAAFLEDTPSEENAAALVSRLHQAYGDGISGTDDAYTTHEQTSKSSGRRITHQQTRQLDDVRTTSDQTQQRTDICTTRERAQKLSGVRKTREQNHQLNGMCTMPEQTQQINETPHWLKNGRTVLMSLSECSGETVDAAEPWRARDRLDTRRVGCGPSKAARHFNAGGTTPDGSDYTPCDRGHPVRMGCFRGEQTDGILVHENISEGSCWDYPSRTNRVKSGSSFVDHADGDRTPSPLPSPPAPHKSTKRRNTSKLRKPLEGNHHAATGCFLQEHQDGDLPQRGPRANQNQSGGFVAHNSGLGNSIDPLVAAVNLDMAPDRVAKAVVLDEMESDPVVTAVDVDMMQSESAVTAVGLDIVPDPVDIAVGLKMQSGLVATAVCLEVTSVKPHDEEDAQPMSVMTVRPQTLHAGSQSPSVGDKSPYKQCSEPVRTPRRRLQEEEETDQALQATTNASPQHSQHSRRSQASMCAESYDNSGLGTRSPCSIQGEGNCSPQHGRQNESRVYAKICASKGLDVFSPTSNEDVRTSSATQDGGKTQSKRFPRKDQPFFQRPGNGGQDDIGATFLPLAQEEPWAAIFPPAQEEESWAGSLGRSKLGDKSDHASKTSGSTAAGEKLRLEEGEAAATVSTNENEKPVVVAPAAFIEPATHDVCHHSVPNDQSMPNRRDVPVERTTQECEVDARDCTVDACISKVDADFGKGDAHRCCATDITAGESNAKPAVQEQSDGDLGLLQQAPETSSAPEEFQQQLLQLGEMALYDRTQHIQKQATSGAVETPDLAVRELAPLQPPSTAVPRIDATTGEPGAETTEAGKQGGEGETCVADGVAGGSQKCTSYHTPHLNCPDGEKAQSSSPFVESADGGRGYVGPWVMPTAARGNAHIASTTAELRSVALPSPPRHAVALPPPTKNEGKEEEGGNNRGLNQHGSVWDVQKESGSNRKLYRDGNVWEVQEEALPFRVKPLPRHVASLPPACDGVKEGVGSNRTLDQGGNVWGLHKEGGSNPKLDRDDNVWEMQEEALACRAAPASEYTGSLSPAGDKVGEEVEGGRGNNRRSDQGGKVFELREQGVSNHRLNHGSTGVRMMGDTRRCVRFRDSWEHPAVVSARRSETTTPDRANGYLFRRSGQPPDWVVRDGEKSAAMAMSVHHGNVRGTQGGCAPRGGFSNGIWEGVCGGADCFNVGRVSTPEGAYPLEVGDDDGATVVPPLSSLPREGMAPFLFAGLANGRRDNAARTFRNPLLAALDVSNPLLDAVIIREADGLR